MAIISVNICGKFLLILITVFNIKVGVTLRINRLEVPPAIAKGLPVTLHCNFDLEGDELYSVKYYKDYVEFYRFLPTDEPKPGQKFKLKGADVDILKSNATHAFLPKTDLDSEGRYACEVSTEGPSFSTIRAERQMKVYVLPTESLKLDASEVEYDVDETINVTCKSGESRPPLNLTWFINDNMIPDDHLIHYRPQTLPNGLHRTKLGLILRASPNYFHRGMLKLLCVATLTLVYEFESVEYLIVGTAKNKSLGPSNIWKEWSLQPDRETPEIRGGKQRYHVNDVLNMNCTTSAHDAQLKWYINSDEANATQLIKYNSGDSSGHNSGHNSGHVLGLRFVMEQQHFQIPELKLRCVALFHRTMAVFKQDLEISTYNPQIIEAQSANVATHSNFAMHAKYGGLWNSMATIVVLTMQSIFLGG